MSYPREEGSLKTLAVGDIAGDFFVPASQRGYRWGAQEVRQLLEDIRASDGASYYLQPIVVKGRADGSWELIDGQQRLTTLYLIFQYLKREHLPTAALSYSITYETREGSKEYLQRLNAADADRNIDYFHLNQAYVLIEEWFKGFGHRATHEATRFYGYLFEGVSVLWYEAPENVDSTELFTRLNVGRIPLTDAELVKALLLSSSQGSVGHTDRDHEIAAYWDGAERDLRSPEVWAFATGDSAGQATHISLLLDSLAGGPSGRERPLFHTFEQLRAEIVRDPQAFWRSVVELHSLVLGWYEDRDLYHKVGYLTSIGRTFRELVDLSRGRGRSDFEDALDALIRSHLQLKESELADLTYGSSKASDVLLLMNVETIRRMADSFERYSFRAHAAGHWSLEHIHAQNAEKLNKVEQWETWLKEHRSALEELPGLNEERRVALLSRIEDALSGTVTQQMFTALEAELLSVFSPDGESPDGDIDSITNLALLDNRDNAALSNSVFEVKRRRIIDRDKLGSYIPTCTRNVFLKYYTDASGLQPHFWSGEDRQAYLAAIADAVAGYLQADEVAG
jgi:hypothetical protein